MIHLHPQQALDLLNRFKSKMKAAKKAAETGAVDADGKPTDHWLSHRLTVPEEEEKKVTAKDANMKNDADWYEIHDPRNPLSKQRHVQAAKDSRDRRRQRN